MKENAKTIALNLRRIANSAGKTQADISKALQINKGTVSTWFVGTRIPRMDKIDLLCDYFGVTRSDILEDHEESKNVFVISLEDMELISAFKNASRERQKIILEILGLPEKNSELSTAEGNTKAANQGRLACG